MNIPAEKPVLTPQEMRQQSGPRHVAVCSVAVSTVGAHVCMRARVRGARV